MTVAPDFIKTISAISKVSPRSGNIICRKKHSFNIRLSGSMEYDFNGKKIWGKAKMQNANVVIESDSLPVVEISFIMLPDKDGNMIYFQE